MAQLISSDFQGRRRIAGQTTLTAILLFCLLACAAWAATAQAAQARPLVQPGAIRVVPDAAYYDTLAALITNATRRIDLAMFLFKTSPADNNRPAGLVSELVAARLRGVAVRVILEYSGHDHKLNQANQATAALLKKGGVAVFFDSPNRTSHAKLAVIDRRYCLVGSHNLTQSALKHNHELSLLLDNPQLAEEILAYLETILK
ncbi:MAG: phospholipase [Proteobacteria bacterium]|nr:phospholipase [Pseudomonadota bacterium]MBU1546588.1 phospholipase [Pseudomonadota bacterium]MBU2620246.1 phospholipase [Pseudomonadota bacterium]